jgi:hypothetical protein
VISAKGLIDLTHCKINSDPHLMTNRIVLEHEVMQFD